MTEQTYTLIGYPLGHSMSPWIHERLFRLSGKQAEYHLTEIPPEKLEQKIPELKKLNGFNITIPYKTDIIPFLDRLDESAELFHSVNCVANGNFSIGYNTDCDGFLRSVPAMEGKKILLTGCGGVGRMMAISAVMRHADLTISEPNQEKAEALVQEIRTLEEKAHQMAAGVGHVSDTHYQVRLAQADELDESFDLIMNASPLGMYPKTDRCPVKDNLIQKCSAVFDVIYNPTETLFMKKARAFGKTAVGGAAMLVWQAVRAHEIWYHSRFRREDIENLISEMEQEINRLFPIEKKENQA